MLANVPLPFDSHVDVIFILLYTDNTAVYCLQYYDLVIFPLWFSCSTLNKQSVTSTLVSIRTNDRGIKSGSAAFLDALLKIDFLRISFNFMCK